MERYNFDIVVLADGDFPSHPIPLKILDEARYLVCCDNAGKRLIEKGRVPDAIVGDGDSLPETFKERYWDIYHQVDEQDFNDLTKATRFGVAKAERRELKTESGTKGHRSEQAVGETSAVERREVKLRVAYLGATGKREDHSIGNISLMNYYRRVFGIEPVMITDYGVFTAHEGDEEIVTFPRQQVSIFNMTAQKMSAQGLKWSIAAYEEWWMGTLNEALGNSIRISADGAYIVFRTHEKK